MRVNSKVFLTVFAALSLGALSACGDSTGVNGDVSGTFTLRSIAGQLPYTDPNQDASDFITVNGGNIILNAGGSSSVTLIYTETLPGQTINVTSTCLGSFTQSGNAVVITEPDTNNPDCGTQLFVVWNGSNTLTLSIDVGIDAVFKK